LHLDIRNCVLHCSEVARGTINQALVHPREVFRVAIEVGACSVILAHNHPSGNVTASAEDTELTGRLVKAGNIIGINVTDHLIIGVDSFSSLLETNYSLFKE
jgi:DNA repair protein RadC